MRLARTVPILRAGGKIVSYGMTLAPKTPFTMSAVFKNVEVCPFPLIIEAFNY